MQSNGFHALTLVDKKREFDEVYTFRFEPKTPVSFLPGQYVHLLAPHSPPGRENVRHLSIASVPDEGPLRFTVDLSSASDYKRKLGALSVGGQAHLFKVKGEFVLGNSPPSRVFFLAGGLGITPIRALMTEIHRGRAVEWKLAHVARGDHLYEGELAALGGDQRRIRREGLGLLLDAWVSEVPEAVWYVAGSHRFVTGVTEALALRGVGANRLRTEDFE